MLRDSIRTAAPLVQQEGRSSRGTIVTPAGSTTSTTLVELSALQQDVTALGTYVNHLDPLDSMQSGSNVGATCIIHDDEIDDEFNRARSLSWSALPLSSPSTSSTQSFLLVGHCTIPIVYSGIWYTVDHGVGSTCSIRLVLDSSMFIHLWCCVGYICCWFGCDRWCIPFHYWYESISTGMLRVLVWV
jgi:hypothetical protein